MLYLLMALVGLFSCSQKNEMINEGQIIFAMDYPQMKDKFFVYSVLPKTMNFYFKNNQLCSKVEKMGTENSMWIDCNQKQLNTYFQFGEQKLCVAFNEMDLADLKKDNEGYQIKFTKEEDTLCGLPIKKAIATERKTGAEFELWYTDQIKVKDPNWYSPYKEVPGILLKYSIVRYGVLTEIKATKINKNLVPDKIFEPKKQGKKVSYKEFGIQIDLITSFMNE